MLSTLYSLLSALYSSDSGGPKAGCCGGYTCPAWSSQILSWGPQSHCLELDPHSSPHAYLVHGGLFEGAAQCAPALRLCLPRKWTVLRKKLLLPPEAQEQWPVGHSWVCIWSEPQNWTIHVHSPQPRVPFFQQGWSGLSLGSWQDQRVPERWRYLLAL